MARVQKWYSKSVTCESDPEVVRRERSKLRVALFKEIVTKELTLDTTRTLQQFAIVNDHDDRSTTLIAATGVLMDEENLLEERIDHALQLLIRVDDRIEEGWNEQARSRGHLDEEKWNTEMGDLQAYLVTWCDALCESRGWK